jgi:hypothetical protein
VTYAYRRVRLYSSVLAQDFLLGVVLVALAVVRPGGPLAVGLAVAIPLVWLWGIFTLHFPWRVDLTDRGVSFHAYGRVHHFRWADVAELRVRRFLLGDRVLVRVTPAPPWRGRYWVLDGIEGYPELVRALAARQAARREPTRVS